MSCKQDRNKLFVILCHMRMSKAQAVNEMCIKFGGQELKFVAN
jgi:hypothetical protein